MNIKALVANILWFAHSAMRARTWKKAIHNVRAVQEDLLFRLVKENADSEFGREHSFAEVRTVADFQRLVPIRSYDAFSPYVDRIACGWPNVLTTERVVRFGLSSGSTSASKLIPYTGGLVRDFQEGIDPWMYHLMGDHPRMLGGTAYWSVTPVGQRERRSAGGIPIGFDDERSYFGGLTQWVLGNVMAVPSELALVRDMDAFRYATLRFMLQERSLAWISIWNPTFMTLLLRPLKGWFELLIDDVRTGSMSVSLGVPARIDAQIRSALRSSPRRARELERIRKRGGANLYEEIWPKLQFISCWAHGSAADTLRELRACFPHVPIQPKGLIATEAFVSFPTSGEASAVSILSHFFEFEDVESRQIVLAHELILGKKYGVIATTRGGFYRYRLNDVIEVLGRTVRCPLIRFVGRQDKVVDLCGEKLNEEFARSVVLTATKRLGLDPRFWMVAPERNGSTASFYVLFIQNAADSDDDLRALRREVEAGLRENYHYNYCRQLGQLEELKLFSVECTANAHEIYLSVCAGQGQRLGDIKPAALHPFQHWSEKFQGRFV